MRSLRTNLLGLITKDYMKYTYIRIDEMTLFNYPRLVLWLQDQPDVEHREDYLCWFVRAGSKTHTWLAVTYPEVLKYSV